jgi:hypothetical protein
MPSFYHSSASLGSFIENIRKIPGASLTSEWVGPPRFKERRTSVVSHKGGIDFSLQPSDFGHQAEGKQEHDIRGSRYREIFESVEARGIEALAWYRSFHYDDSDWGIYIPESSLFMLADVVFGREALPKSGDWVEHERKASAENLRKAWLLLWSHEIFHFATDLAIARWETVLRRPLWAFDRFRRRQEGVDYWLYEERAANAQMLRHLKPRLEKKDMTRLEAFTLRQPPGYREALEALPDQVFGPLLEELMRAKIGILGTRAVDGLMNRAISAASFIDVDDDSLAAFHCPVYILRDADSVLRPSIKEKIVTSLPIIEESKRFSKMLARMHPDYRKRWARKKAELSERIPPYPEFEKFSDGPPPTFSIRLSKSARAHIRHRASDGAWVAIAVGEHTEMGHD